MGSNTARANAKRRDGRGASAARRASAAPPHGQATYRNYELRPGNDIARGAPRIPGILLAAKAVAAAARRQVREALGLTMSKTSRRIKKPWGVIVLDVMRVKHITCKFEHHRERCAKLIWLTLQQPDEVWRVFYPHARNGKGAFRIHYIKFFRGAPHGVAICADEPNGHVLFNFIPMRRAGNVDNKRYGALVYSAAREQEESE